MKITVVCEYFYPDDTGGTPTDMSELTRFLAGLDSGLEIEVVTSRNTYRGASKIPDLPRRENWCGVNIVRLRTPRSNRPSMLFRLVAGTWFSIRALIYLMFTRRADVVLIVTNPPANALTGWALSRARGIPYVYFVNDLYPDIAVALGKLREDSFSRRFFCFWQQIWLREASRVVVVGRCMRDRIVRNYNVSNGQISVVRNWADPTLNSEILSGSCFDMKGGNDFVVLYGGNFSHYVDFNQILEAARLLDCEQGIRFILIGDGVRRGDLMRQVATEGLRNVEIMNPVARSAMGSILRRADVCLVPLDPRMLGLGSPGKLYSILAAGRPVIGIVPAGSEVALILEEERCGVNVSNGDAVALAAAILRMRGNPAMLSEMGIRARFALERRFTLQAAGAAFYQILTSAADKDN